MPRNPKQEICYCMKNRNEISYINILSLLEACRRDTCERESEMNIYVMVREMQKVLLSRSNFEEAIISGEFNATTREIQFF